MNQQNLLGLMALGDAFGSLGAIGGGNPGPQRALPFAIQMGQEQERRQRAMDALRQSGQLEGNPALAALAGEYPELVSQEILRAQFQRPGNPYDRYKVVPGVGLVDLAGQNGGPGVAIPSREEDPWGGAKVVGGRVVNPDGTVRFEAPPEAPTPDAKQRQVDALVASGVDLVTAIGIANGRLKLDSFTGQVVDIATGQPWNGSPAAPSAPPPSAGPAAPGQAFMPPPIVPTEGADYPGATGGQGIVGNIANTVADFVGGNLPAPQQERAAQAFDNLRVRTMTTLQEAVPGRPSNMVIELLGQMTVEGGRITMGKERAKERLSQTRDFIRQDVEKLNRIIDPANGFSRDQRANARMQLEDRTQLLSDYDAILQQFDAQTQQPAASGSAARPRARNQQTGEIVEFDGSAWVPVQ